MKAAACASLLERIRPPAGGSGDGAVAGRNQRQAKAPPGEISGPRPSFHLARGSLLRGVIVGGAGAFMSHWPCSDCLAFAGGSWPSQPAAWRGT